jgi:phosphoenolpyruvate synthase/pyruvate phosphate dikinase
MALNGLMHWNDQKYKLEDQIRADYPVIQQGFLEGEFPPDILDKFQALLAQVGNKPLIVRSSSLLEDNFGTSFAGKYESYFCPNQGSEAENLQALSRAITRVYASIFNPDALLYRRAKGLQDYDERMAILIQVVEGERYGRYYLPHAAGVAFSRNVSVVPQIRRDTVCAPGLGFGDKC